MSTAPQAALFRPLLASLLLCLALPRQTTADLVIARFGGIDNRSDTGALLGSIGIPGAGYVTSVIQLSDNRLVAFDYTNGKYYVIGTDGSISAGVATIPLPLTALALPTGGFLAAGSNRSIYRYDAAFNLDIINTPFTTIYGLALTPNPIEILYSILTLQRLNLDTKVSTFVFNNTTGLGGLQYAGGIPNLPAGTAYVGAESAGPLFISASFTVLGRFTSPGQSGFTDVAALPNGSIAGCAPASGLCTLWNANGTVNSSFSAGVYPYNVIHIADGSGPSSCANQAVSLTAHTAPGTCRASVDQTKLFNLCPGWQVVNPVPDSAKEYLQGIHLETWTLSDGSQTKPLQTTVTVLDKEAPVLTTPGNLSVNLLPGETTIQVNFTVTASDNCSGAIPVHSTPSSGTFLPLGEHTVFCQATDSGGNTGTSTFKVTVAPAGPFIKTVQPDPNLGGAWVYFSDEMSTSALDEMGHYSIDDGVTITDAQSFGSQVVHLSLTGLQNGNTYTLTVNDAEIPVSPNQITFTVDVTTPTEPVIPGIASFQVFDGVQSLPELKTAIQNRAPDRRFGLSSAESLLNFDDNYGGRVQFFITPQETGVYTFYFASDDEGEFYLSTDANPANKVLIAQETAWNSHREWNAGGENNSSQNTGNQWAGGSAIGLTAGNRYYAIMLWREGGGGDNGSVTFGQFGAAPPANGTPSALTGDLISWYLDPDVPPVITSPPQSVEFQRGDTIEFNVGSWSPLPESHQWFVNKQAIPGANGPTLTIPNATTAHIGDISVEISNANGTTHTHLNDARAQLVGAPLYFIGAADFNNHGNHVPEASQLGYLGGAYSGLSASVDIDFNDNADQAGGNAVVYRGFHPSDANVVEIGPGSVNLHERDKGDFTLVHDFKIGWTDAGEWYNYTRIFPPGTYHGFVEAAKEGFAWNGPDDPNAFRVSFFTVTNPHVPDGSREHFVGGQQGLTFLGDASFPGTGNWDTYDVIPFADSSGNPSQISINGETTVRLIMGNFGDFTGTRLYQVAPYVPEIPNQTTEEDTDLIVTFTTQNNHFTVSGVTADSDNRGLFPPGGITIVSDGDNHTVTLPPAENQSGSAIVTLTIRSNGDPVFRKFTLTVTPVDDPPTIGQINDVVVEEDSHPAQNPYRITLNGLSAGPADENQAYTVTTTSDNPGLVSHLVPGDLNGDGKVDLVDFGIDKDNFGSAEIKVTISDGNTSVDKIFNVTVTPVDDPPTIDPIPGQSWLEDGFSAQNPVRITLTGLSGGPPNENQAYTITATSDAPAVVPNPVVLDSNGDGMFDSLDLHSAQNANGMAGITVTINDGNTSVNTIFDVTVTPVDDPPTIGQMSDVTLVQGLHTESTPFVSDPVSYTGGPPDEPQDLLFSITSDPGNFRATLIDDDFFGQIRGRFIPEPGAAGTFPATITVSDGNSSASTDFLVTILPDPNVSQPPTILLLNDPNDLPIAVQQSDPISKIQFQAIDPDSFSGQLSSSVTHTIDGGAEIDGLPQGLQFNLEAATPPGQLPGEIHLNLEGPALGQLGSYVLNLKVNDQDGNQTSATPIKMEVNPEDFQVNGAYIDALYQLPYKVTILNAIGSSATHLRTQKGGGQVWGFEAAGVWEGQGHLEEHSGTLEGHLGYGGDGWGDNLYLVDPLNGNFDYNLDAPASGEWGGQATLGGVWFFPGVLNDGVSVLNPDGFDPFGDPYLDTGRREPWKVREKFTIKVNLGNPNNVPVQFEPKLQHYQIDLGGGTRTTTFIWAVTDPDGNPPNWLDYHLKVSEIRPDGSIEFGTAPLYADPLDSSTAFGSWTDVTGATSPYSFTPTAEMLYGRLRE